MKSLSNNLHKVLKETAKNIFKGKLVGDIQYGWHQKSVGQAILFSNQNKLWLKVCQFESLENAHQYLNRLKVSDYLKGINKPIIRRYFAHSSLFNSPQEKRIILILLMTYINDLVCSTTAELTYPFNTSETWLNKLEEQLNSLAEQSSNFIACRQELINRRIQERFGNNIPNLIEHWCTIHGDIHWSNLTQKTASILDWEGWGKGPRFLDVSLLYCFSLLQKPVANLIKNFFSKKFETLDAKICLLFSCSELMRMHELHGDYKELYPKLKVLSNTLCNEII